MTENSEPEDIRSRVEASETWRRHTVTSAHMFANDGIKTLIVLNGGTFVALPALKGLSDSVDIETLFPSIVCFMAGLVMASMAQFFAYLSITLAAHGHLEHARAWEVLWRSRQNPKVAHALSAVLKKHDDKSERHQKWATYLDYVATLAAIASLVLFIFGGYQGIEAFYPANR